MLIAGTGGFSLESLEILIQLGWEVNVTFFNDIDPKFQFKNDFLASFPILRNRIELKSYFEINPEFILGIGNPNHRNKIYDIFQNEGGIPQSLISPKAIIGKINNTIGLGVSIMTGVIVTSNVTIGKGSLINLNSTIGHDCVLGEFVEISPGVNVSGNCKIGNKAFVGTNATILPNISVGDNSIIAAGAVVNKNVEDFTMVAGNPAVVKKKLTGYFG